MDYRRKKYAKEVIDRALKDPDEFTDDEREYWEDLREWVD